DSSGAQYVGGTLTVGSDTRGMYAKIDNRGGLVWNFIWLNFNPGPGGAVNGVVESGGFLYMTGTLNASALGAVHQDMILAKVKGIGGALRGGYAEALELGGGNGTDVLGEAIAVRNGEAFPAGRLADFTQPPGFQNAFILHFDSDGGFSGNP